ncbi:MAG TPA: Rrf2 family transcriptional regulator [Pseudogracilibacillus sp.]|nr:Rrf2 family transcriptional regulator [Pseudogracilibacillus sp.]
MKISTKGRYGLTIMLELAREYGKGPMSLKAIANKNELSIHYLEQLATPLRNAGLVKSIRGAYGGYQLVNEPAEITVGDIIRVLEGPITLVEGIEEQEPAQQNLWLRATEAVKEVLDTTSLLDLMQTDTEKIEDAYMFYI